MKEYQRGARARPWVSAPATSIVSRSDTIDVRGGGLPGPLPRLELPGLLLSTPVAALVGNVAYARDMLTLSLMRESSLFFLFL